MTLYYSSIFNKYQQLAPTKTMTVQFFAMTTTLINWQQKWCSRGGQSGLTTCIVLATNWL